MTKAAEGNQQAFPTLAEFEKQQGVKIERARRRREAEATSLERVQETSPMNDEARRKEKE